MKKKNRFLAKILSLLILVVMGFGAMSFTKGNIVGVYASAITETSVVKIGEDGYESLKEAIDAVENNETIVVLKDIDSCTPILIDSGKTFTIDFSDGSTQHYFRWFDTMGTHKDKDIFTIDDNSNVTVKNMQYKIGEGERGNRVFNVNSSATLTLVNMLCAASDNIKDTPVRNNGGTVIIDGGDFTTFNINEIGFITLNPVVQNLNNGITTFKGNGTYTMKNSNTGVAWLGNVITQPEESSDVDRETSCGTITIENGTFNGGHIVDVNGKGTIIINDATYGTGNGPLITTFHGGVKSTITINNITSSATVFAQVFEELNTKIDFQNGNVKYTKFCMNKTGGAMTSVSIKGGKFGPKNGTTDIYDEIESYLADGAVISSISEDGYTYKVETPVTPADILPDNLLASSDNKWDNENGYSILYVYDGKIWLQDGPTTFVNDLSITAPLTKSGDDYTVISGGITYTFTMEDGVLTSISVSGAANYRFNGTYTAPHIHSYGEVSSSWNGDQLTLTVECSCGDEQTQTFTATYQQVSKATCTVKETGKYVLTIEDGIFAGAYETDPFERGEALGHDISKVNGQSPTCTDDGWEDAYFCEECNKYFVDENGITLIGDEAAYESWKLSGGAITALNHNFEFSEFVWDGFTAKAKYVCSNDPTHVDYHNATVTSAVTTNPTCTTDGVRTYTATYDGHTDTKTEVIDAIGHHLTKVNGQSPTCTDDGWEDAYYCDNCGLYFEDENGITLIGDETAYNTWKLNEGLLPRLLSVGALVGICIGSFLLLLVAVYLIGYFFLYRKGKLDEKKIKVVYKILPRGEYSLKGDKK